ncbi:MAG: hypothetical protein JWQ53_2093, partial [Klenkia sp.]|nr:hypothetical protein [Klenkia sp.]
EQAFDTVAAEACPTCVERSAG